MFEIFFHHEDNKLMNDFAERLRAHRTVFTPYLGITECIANFKFLWDEEVQSFEGVSKILSAFKLSNLKEFKLRSGTGIVREHLPLFIDAQRNRQTSDEVVFNPYAKPIIAEVEGSLKYPNRPDETFTFIG